MCLLISELPWWRVVLRITWVIVEIGLVCGLLYIFICSIAVLGDSFELLGGEFFHTVYSALL